MQAKELSKLLSVSQFIIELLRFQVCKPVVFFYCIRRLWKYRTLESIQVLVLFIEKLGPLYLSMKEIASLMNSELNHILSVCKSKLVDLNASALLMNAYYTCRPAERPRVKRVELPPQIRYLQYLLNDVLIKGSMSEEEIANHILHFNVNDDTTLLMIVHEILKVPTNSFPSIDVLTILCCELNYQFPKFGVFLIDAIFERITYILDFMPTSCQQEAVGLIEFIYLLYDYKMLNANQIFFILYLLIEYGHNVYSLILSY